jgi:hypothetical protein
MHDELDCVVRTGIKDASSSRGAVTEERDGPVVRKNCGGSVERYRKNQFVAEKSGECGAIKSLRETQNYSASAPESAAGYYSDKKC